MKKRFWSISAFAVLVVSALSVLLGPAVFGMRPMVDGLELGGGAAVQLIDGYSSIAVLTLDAGSVALVDCGNDPQGVKLLAALHARGLGRDAVKAIFLTHGHFDHLAGCHLFPGAEVYAFAGDVKLAAGQARSKGPLTRFFKTPPDKAVKVTRLLRDGEVVRLGAIEVTAFAVPGHTAGSAAFLSSGVLYLGDNAGARANGTLRGASWPFTDDPAQNLFELRRLCERLRAMNATVTTLVFAHTGPFEGVEGLHALAGQ